MKVYEKEVHMDVIERKSNFELLRIITMIMIVTMHVLDHSGIFLSKDFTSFNFVASSLINGFSIVAVNCYILISGYFGYKQEFKKEKLINLYIQVIFISIAISVIFWSFRLESLDIRNIVKTFMPIISQTWWFISVYFALYIISPYINKLIANLDKKQLEGLILVSIIIFVIWPSISIGDLINPINEDGGYGLYNFILLYVIGSYIGKYINYRKRNKYSYLMLYIFSMSILVAINLLITNLTNNYTAKLSYDFMLVYIGSISLFLFFRDINIKSNKINYLSSLTLGVYLIHEHPFIRNIIGENMRNFKLCSSNKFIIYLISIVGVVYFASSIFEYFRVKIFKIVTIKNKSKAV